MDENRRVTLCGLICDLDEILVRLDELRRKERANVEKEQQELRGELWLYNHVQRCDRIDAKKEHELGELCDSLVDTDTVDGLTDAIDKLEVVRTILNEL